MGSHVRQNVGCQHQCPNMEENFGRSVVAILRRFSLLGPNGA